MKRIFGVVLMMMIFCLFGCGGLPADNKQDVKAKSETIIVKKENAIRNTKDDKIYDKNIEIVSNGNKETIYVTNQELKTEEISNKPSKVVLKFKNGQVVFESLWNDGIFIRVADFDSTDKDKDIYITELGTDIQSITYIYKFDGKKIRQYGEFSHLGRDFRYDEQGKIYFWNNDGEKEEIDTIYDYKSKILAKIKDNILKAELNK